MFSKFFSGILYIQTFVANSHLDLSQYGSYLFLLILTITLIPAIILGILQIKTKYYGFLASIAMAVLLVWFARMNFKYFVLFLAVELLLIIVYSLLVKKYKSKYLYFIFLVLSVSPLVIYKFSALFGYSFFGFLGLSYINFRAVQIIIELYDGSIKKVNFFDLFYFLTFFPTLSSGPIDRYRRFLDNINQKIPRKEYLCDLLPSGIRKIIMGIGYKFVIAYLINTFWLTQIPSDHSFLNTVNYMYAYSFYLFFDFAGYSNFAVGTSYILGVKTPANFFLPFLSTSIKDFWTRWHITLSKWFGDYIYSRVTIDIMRKKIFKSRQTASYIAQLITMLTMGAWHGLAVNYLIYGLYHGLLLIGNDMYERRLPYYKNYKNNFTYQLASVFVTFHLVCFGFLIFSGNLI